MAPHLYAEILRKKETKTVNWVGLNSSEIEKKEGKDGKFHCSRKRRAKMERADSADNKAG